MKVTVLSIFLCGAALAASPGGESQKSSDTPAEATHVEAPAEGAADDKRDKRQWFAPGFSPGFIGRTSKNPGFNSGFNNNHLYMNFNPKQWWNSNYADPNFGGISGMSQMQWRHYMQQMHQFMNNPPNTGFQFTSRDGVRPGGANIFPDVINTGANGAMQFLPMPMLQYMYTNGFAPPLRSMQPAFFQNSWQQYFSQFTNRSPGAPFGLRPQREVNTGSVNGMSEIPMESSFRSPVEDTMTGSA